MKHRVQRKQMPAGEAGFAFTIHEMSKAAMGEYGARSPRIREATVDLLRHHRIDSHDIAGEIDVCNRHVRDTIRYVRDPAGIEFITYPETLLFDTRQGDCDDHCVLLAAMLGSIGIKTRFVIVQTPPNPTFNHVYLYADNRGVQIPCDPIMKKRPTGWQVPDAIRTKVFPVNTDSGTGYLSTTALLGMLFGAWRWLHGLGKV